MRPSARPSRTTQRAVDPPPPEEARATFAASSPPVAALVAPSSSPPARERSEAKRATRRDRRPPFHRPSIARATARRHAAVAVMSRPQEFKNRPGNVAKVVTFDSTQQQVAVYEASDPNEVRPPIGGDLASIDEPRRSRRAASRPRTPHQTLITLTLVTLPHRNHHPSFPRARPATR